MTKKKSSGGDQQDKAIEELNQLFLTGRDHQSDENNEEAHAAYEAAEAFANKHGWEVEAELARLAMRALEKNDEALLEQLEALRDRSDAKLPALIDYWRASVLYELNRSIEAIEVLESLLDTAPAGWLGRIYYNVGMAYSNKGDYDTAIDYYKKALAESSYKTPGNAHNNMGSAYADMGEYDTAIDCYKNALAESSFKTKGTAYYNIGLTYSYKGEYDTAIDYYKKALAESSYKKPGNAYNNMGLTYADKGEYDTAIDCYKKALAESSYKTPGNAYSNMGLAYAVKGEYDRAIENYQKALVDKSFARPGTAHHGMGNAYTEKGEHENAIESFRKAAHAYEEDKNPGLSYVLRQIDRLTQKIDKSGGAKESLSLTKDERGPDAGTGGPRINDREMPIYSKLIDEPKDAYRKYIEQAKAKRADEIKEVLEKNCLSVLRGWSSALTLADNSGEGQYAGGGYLLRWRNKGLVIDPGFDFLGNFHEAGFFANDIDMVVISHDHPDHNHDLLSIDDLFYELHRRGYIDGKTGKEWKYHLYCDADTKSRRTSHMGDSSHRFGPIPFDHEIVKTNRKFYNIRSLPFEFTFFDVKHGTDVPHALGLCIDCQYKEKGKDPFRIGYTGDTEYSSQLARSLKGSDVLLAHISQPAEAELLSKWKPGPPTNWLSEEELETYERQLNDNSYKRAHLGYRGLIQLIKDMDPAPKAVLIGEFWAGQADVRIEITKAIQASCPKGVRIIPTSKGLNIELETLKIQCNETNKWIGLDDVLIEPPSEPFGPLRYISKKVTATC